MAYTLFDLAALLKLQGSLTSRLYDHSLLGTTNSEYLYGDNLVLGSLDGKLLIKANDRISAGGGNDALFGGIGNDLLNGQSGNDFLDGGDDSDLLLGDIGNDILYGGRGEDFLNGGTGIDDMRGGDDNDTYVVDNSADKVIETLAGDESIDTVMSTASYTLGANVENLILTGAAAINATGNNIDNVLYGNSGINTLSGAEGNDKYYVQNTGDVVNESSTLAGTEWNIVFSSASYALTPGSQIDEFILIGSASITATGNELDNLIEGNAGSNRIYGGGGDDTLGGVPLDVVVAPDFSHWATITANLGLDQGTDILYGGAGDDMMFLGASDRIVENAAEGYDTAVCGYSHVLEANVESLDFYGHLGSTAKLTGIGNTLDNYIISNLGADTLIGKTGNDDYEVFNSGVIVKEFANEGDDDTVWAHVDFKLANFVEDLVLMETFEGYTPLVGIGNTLNNVIFGNSESNVLDGRGGDDRLIGGGGNDQLTGGAGADIFIFGTALDAENVDTIHDFRSGEDVIELDRSVFGALPLGPLNASDFIQGAGDGNAPTQLANEHILFDTDTGTLFYDADGSGAGEATAFAVLNPGPTGFQITAGDFFIVV